LDRVLPAVSAAASAVVLAALLLPLVLTRQYRLRGSPDAGRLAHRFLALLYACALANYAFGPLPDRSSEIVCRDQPQLVPLGGLAGLDLPVSGRQLLAGLAREPNQQFALNVLLFLPLGMLLRSAFRLRPPVLAAAGFAVSALVELTQLTGLWFAYPCPYRLFDVDDLVANTTGALIGGVLGPLLPRPAPVDRPPQLPRPVTRPRRLAGMACDLLLLCWLGDFLTTGAHLVSGPLPAGARSAARWLLPALLLLAAALPTGATLGQRAVLLRPVRADGTEPRRVQTTGRWLVGLGGLGAVQSLASSVAVPWLPLLTGLLWCAAHAWGVRNTRDQRGISGLLTGLTLIDARIPDRAPIATRVRTGWTSAALRPDHRRLRFRELDPRRPVLRLGRGNR
jgi:hypothetical protein